MRWFLLAILAAAFVSYGCATGKKAAQPASEIQDSTDAASHNPEASVDISYALSNDYLRSFSVSKYNAAQLLRTRQLDARQTTALVRLEGGVPTWQFDAGTGFFGSLPGLGSGADLRISPVKYGHVPEHFVQSSPESGSPEPLEPDHYYVFTVRRAAGSSSYEVIKVLDDGSIESYTASPRAGTSYELCCNVTSEFLTVRSAEDQP